MAGVNLRALLIRIYFSLLLVQVVVNYHLLKTSTTFESSYRTIQNSPAIIETNFVLNVPTIWLGSRYKLFYTFRHRIGRPITKWSPNGQTFIAAPEKKLQIDMHNYVHGC